MDRPQPQDAQLTEQGPRLRRLSTDGLTPPEIAAIRELLIAAFGTDEEERFTDDDWEHAVGGLHFVLDVGGEIVTHASVVERDAARRRAAAPDRLRGGRRDGAVP